MCASLRREGGAGKVGEVCGVVGPICGGDRHWVGEVMEEFLALSFSCFFSCLFMQKRKKAAMILMKAEWNYCGEVVTRHIVFLLDTSPT